MKYLVALLCIIAAPLNAHPHIFVATGIDLIVDDQGNFAFVDITWEYDELYSLLITEDLGLDTDYDGVLTPEEETKLTGFDMNWHPDFYGDLVAYREGQRLGLSRPIAPTASFDDGKITTTHRRKFEALQRATDGTLVIKPFDETFYTAYEMSLPIRIIGRDDCTVGKRIPQMTAELSEARAALATLPADQDPVDAGLPNVGEALATEVRITCPVE